MRETRAHHDTFFFHLLILIIPSHPWRGAIRASGWSEGEEEWAFFFLLHPLFRILDIFRNGHIKE